MSTSSTQDTFASTAATTEALVMTQTQHVARYFIEDLSQFVRLTNIDLIKELEIPADPAYGSRDEIIELLFDDLTHMLGEGLITGIHLLLSEPQPDPMTGRYLLRYHATYTVNQSGPGQRHLAADVQRFGGSLAPPKRVWERARFALLIDWNRSADERRRQVHRPRYFFDWVPPEATFDGRSLVRYREGGLTYNGATIVDRVEARSAGYPVNE